VFDHVSTAIFGCSEYFLKGGIDFTQMESETVSIRALSDVGTNLLASFFSLAYVYPSQEQKEIARKEEELMENVPSITDFEPDTLRK
jgi:hypothetical protein